MLYFKVILLLILLCSGNVRAADVFADLEAKYDGELSLYAINQNTGEVISYNENARLPFCSVVKVVIVGALLKASIKQPDILTRKKFISQELVDKSGYAPVTQEYINSTISIIDLAEAAITESDNAATNIIIKEVGGISEINSFVRSLDVKGVFSLDRTEPDLNFVKPGDLRDTTTTKFISVALEKMVFGNLFPEYQKKLLKEWMIRNKTGDKRIRAAIPNKLVIGDKTGGGVYGITNDIGFILPHQCKKPIIISVFYREVDKNAKSNDEIVKKSAELIWKQFLPNICS